MGNAASIQQRHDDELKRLRDEISSNKRRHGAELQRLRDENTSNKQRQDDELQRLRDENSRLRLTRRGTRREAPRVKYYFVRADQLRGTTATTLPALQTMLADAKMRDWVVEKAMNFDDACRGKYLEEYLTCSHRWLTEGAKDPRRAPPDPKGVQLAAIKEHLAAHPEIKYVWLDWPCMWQGDKEGQRDITVDEKAEFDRMLGEVNLLYLGCQVLVLLDLSYLSRFWTMYEGWLSRLQPTAQGLQLAQGAAAARCHIVPILGASEFFKAALVDQIASEMATPTSAAAYLSNDDVSVTNASDKEKQLARVGGLDERVRNVLARDAAMAKVHDAVRAEPMDAVALRSAVLEAEAVGVGDEKLEDAHRVLRAAADRAVLSQEEMLRAENRLLKDELEEQRGAVLGAMMLAGATAALARASGYSLNELKAAGCVEGLKAAGFTCTEVKAAGFLTSEVARAGYGADEAKAAGFFKTIEEAKVAGYVEGLKAGGFSGLKAAGFTCAEAKRGGFSLWESRQGGYTCSEAKQAGYVEGLKAAGYTCAEAKQAGFTCAEARHAGFNPRECMQVGFTFQEGVAAGYPGIAPLPTWDSRWNYGKPPPRIEPRLTLAARALRLCPPPTGEAGRGRRRAAARAARARGSPAWRCRAADSRPLVRVASSRGGAGTHDWNGKSLR